MTIYIVTSGEYSDYGIQAVFIDRKKAVQYCAAHESNYDCPEIEEWETDDSNIETSATVNEYWLARLTRNGELDGLKKRYTLKACCPCRVSAEFSSYSRFRNWLDVNVVLPCGTPKDKAKKIMYDAVAKWRYEHLVEGKANDT